MARGHSPVVMLLLTSRVFIRVQQLGGTFAVDAARVREALIEEQRVHGVASVVVLLDVAPAAGDRVATPGVTANSHLNARSRGLSLLHTFV